MDINAELRKLARSDYWQMVYNTNKTNSGIQIFKNTTDLSSVQIQFLHWLSVYNMLYTELAQKESKYLTEKVIKNDNRCDAYLYYRRTKIDNDWFKYQQNKKINESKEKHNFKDNKNVQVIDVDLRRG